MAEKKQKPNMVSEFSKGFVKSLQAENEEFAKMPKVHDHTKGEVITEVDPKDADKHLE